MTTAYLGQIELFAFNFPPKGWAQCNGQLLAINANTALFSVLGTMYGGNGVSTFALPDLRSRVPIGFSSQYVQGTIGGEENHTLQPGEMAKHSHLLMADSTTAAANNGGVPGNNTVLGNSTGTLQNPSGSFTVQIYSNTAANGTMAPQTVGNAGNSLGHPNIMPYLTLNFCIALVGVFPTRN